MQKFLNVDQNLYNTVRNFLEAEAEYLDDGRLREWMQEFLHQEIRYNIPVRQTHMREDGDGFFDNMSLQDDDWLAIRMRVHQRDSKANWTENPPTRVRHHMSSIRLGQRTTLSSAEDFDIEVKSNVLIYRSRGESSNHDLLSAERRDILRYEGGMFKLLSREVRMDQSTIGTHNFSFFF